MKSGHRLTMSILCGQERKCSRMEPLKSGMASAGSLRVGIKFSASKICIGGREAKRRHASIRDLCQVKIRISWCSDLGSVTIEHIGNAVNSHDIEDSFAVKIPTHRDDSTMQLFGRFIVYLLQSLTPAT